MRVLAARRSVVAGVALAASALALLTLFAARREPDASRRLFAPGLFPPVSSSSQADAHARMIHQIGPANKTAWKPLWVACQRTWLAVFPDYAYRLWDKPELEALLREHYPTIWPLYAGYDDDIKRYDLARYVILYHHGGVYADLDVEVVRDFEVFVPRGRVGIAESPFANEGVQNALLTSPARHPFWLHVLRELHARRRTRSVLHATGPGALKAALSNAPAGAYVLLERERWAPPYRENKSAFYGERSALAPVTDARVVTVHHGTCSWCDGALVADGPR
jgi:mannosyltransferase OCH1-like enzyme